jgi:integrase
LPRLITPETIRTLQRKLYRKAKQEPACRFHALYDKVYRADILEFAYRLVRANKGSAGIDGVTFEAIEENEGAAAFIAELEEALRNKTYKPDPVKRVMIPKSDGSQRPLGIPTIRDRVAQMAAKLVIEPIFEADFCKICRANVEDIEETDTGVRILVHGKGKDGYIYPREDTAACIRDYLIQRGPVMSDKDGEPLFVSLSKSDKVRGRITRIGLSKWMDTMLFKAGIAKKGRACHALRHTCGALLYQATRDVKVVQETLRHASIAMAAKYSHVQERGKARYTQQIPVQP